MANLNIDPCFGDVWQTRWVRCKSRLHLYLCPPYRFFPTKTDDSNLANKSNCCTTQNSIILRYSTPSDAAWTKWDVLENPLQVKSQWGWTPPHNKTTVFESPVYTVVPCLIDGSEWKRHERKHKYKRKRRAEWRIDRERGGKPELLFYVSSLVIWTHATHYGASPTADFPPRKKKKENGGDLRPFRQARWAPSWMFLRGQRGRVQTDQRVYEKTLMNSLSYGKEPKGMRLFCSLADCWWLRKCICRSIIVFT